MLLRLHDITFGYRGLPPVLRGASLTVRGGESVAIVGPSGSGKTTLLAVAGGLLRPAAGTVETLDGAGASGGPVARHVSWVLQTVNVLPDRSVIDNVALGAFGDGAARREALVRARDALETVGLQAHAERPVRGLSGGEVQRTVIARSLVSRRHVMLADEPTGQLDRATSNGVVDALLKAAESRALIVVTHDPAVADRCGRRYRLLDGQLVAG